VADGANVFNDACAKELSAVVAKELAIVRTDLLDLLAADENDEGQAADFRRDTLLHALIRVHLALNHTLPSDT
jgi:hypothetical protein